MGAAYVNGKSHPWQQGQRLILKGCQSEGIGATVKHFVANDVEKRRRFLTAEVDERTLREIYLYPFQLILKNSDPWCFMTRSVALNRVHFSFTIHHSKLLHIFPQMVKLMSCSYNRVNGVYCADDPRLLSGILRKEWGFKGLVLSDWVGTYSTVEAINAGLDLEMPGPTKFRGQLLLDAIQANKVSEETINQSAERILGLVAKTRRFRNPDDHDELYVDNLERDEVIVKAAAEAAVLLKNDGHVLPLNPKSKVVVIGYHAAVPTVGGGGSAKVDTMRSISPVTGLRDAGVVFEYEAGVPVFGAVPLPPPETITPVDLDQRESPEKLARPVRLEWFNGSTIGENLCREQFLGITEYMIKERWPSYLHTDYCTRLTFKYTPKTSGNHLLSVLTTGTATLYIDDKEAFHRPQEQHLQREAFYFYRAKFERRFHFSMEGGKTYTFKLESWATEPDALARTIGGAVIQGSGVGVFESVHIPTQIESAATAAANADIAIIFTGTTAEFESEGYDRETMDLTADQYALISAVRAKNKNIVIVNYSGAPVNMAPFVDKVAAIVQCWFPGQEAGHAIARVLTGKTNPCGRLPMTWPRSIEDQASFPNWPTDSNDMIRYEEGIFGGYKHYDLPGKKAPLFPFGFGLSYSSFVISGLCIQGSIRGVDDVIEVSCVVENSGEWAGKTVVQFYVRAPANGPVPRAWKELKAFQKPLVAAKTSERVGVELDKYAVSFYDVERDCWRALKGSYNVLAGFSATDIVASATFHVGEEFCWKGL